GVGAMKDKRHLKLALDRGAGATNFSHHGVSVNDYARELHVAKSPGHVQCFQRLDENPRRVTRNKELRQPFLSQGGDEKLIGRERILHIGFDTVEYETFAGWGGPKSDRCRRPLLVWFG